MADSTEQDRAPHADHTPSPGGRLRAARERKGLTLVQAADALRLDHKLMEALERDDFAALGAPVFVKGHLRKYAALTGEPADDILLAYHQRAGVQEVLPLLDRAALVRPVSSPSGGMPVAAVVGVLLLGGAAGAWWWYEQPVEHPAPAGGLAATNGALAASSIEPEPEAGPTELSGTDTSEAAGGAEPPADGSSPVPVLRSATSLATPPSGAAPPTTGPADAPAPGGLPGASVANGVSDLSPPPGAGATPAARASEPQAPSGGTDVAPSAEGEAAAAVARPGEHVVVLTFTGDSWAEVRDGAGARLYYDLGEAGARRTVHGVPPFEILLGHYANVQVEMDGRLRAIPAESVRGNMARFTLDPT